jgi:adenylate kinase family enzyme
VERVLIIGPCGAGKSTLAAALGARLALPVHHLDRIKWQPGWIEGSNEDLERKLSDIVAGERWLIDGNYGGSLGLRLPRADTVIYLDYPIRLCVVRLLRRIATWRGQSRPDMTEGCPERFDLEFLIYLLRWNSGPKLRTEQRLRGHEDKIVRFRKPAELDRWLASLPQT